MNLIDLPYHDDPLTLFDRIVSMPHPVLLQSADRSGVYGRYDIMSADPSWRVRYTGERLELGSRIVCTRTPLSALGAALDLHSERDAATVDLPFCTGFIGAFGYALHQGLERVPPPPADPTSQPALSGGWYDWSVVTDHWRHTTQLIVGDAIAPGDVATLKRRLTSGERSRGDALTLAEGFRSSLCRDAYREAFETIKTHIAAGDCYQINLARHFAARWRAAARPDFVQAAWHTYRRLVQVQAAAFSAFLGAPEASVLSFSPERFVHLRGRSITTCPIKGTIARQTPAGDEGARRALYQSEKDRAENLMIVDLLRNDLGKVCVTGSVVVDALFETLTLHNVHHLVSRIRGTLRDEVTPLDAVTAVFPGGSITGAPKVAAMRIINALEPAGRSTYCGAIGYIDACGAVDLSIPIRTLIADAHAIHCWGGGGIVADSDVDTEWNEIDLKVGRLMRTLSG